MFFLRVLVRAPPFVKERLVLRVQVLSIALHGVAGMGVGRNDDDRVAHGWPFFVARIGEACRGFASSGPSDGVRFEAFRQPQAEES